MEENCRTGNCREVCREVPPDLRLPDLLLDPGEDHTLVWFSDFKAETATCAVRVATFVKGLTRPWHRSPLPQDSAALWRKRLSSRTEFPPADVFHSTDILWDFQVPNIGPVVLTGRRRKTLTVGENMWQSGIRQQWNKVNLLNLTRFHFGAETKRYMMMSIGGKSPPHNSLFFVLCMLAGTVSSLLCLELTEEAIVRDASFWLQASWKRHTGTTQIYDLVGILRLKPTIFSGVIAGEVLRQGCTTTGRWGSASTVVYTQKQC